MQGYSDNHAFIPYDSPSEIPQQLPQQKPRLSSRRDTVTVLLDTIRCWYNPNKRYKQRWLFGRKVSVATIEWVWLIMNQLEVSVKTLLYYRGITVAIDISDTDIDI